MTHSTQTTRKSEAPALLDSRSAAQRLRITQRELSDLVKGGKLRAMHPTVWSIRFRPADIEAYRQRQGAKA